MTNESDGFWPAHYEQDKITIEKEGKMKLVVQIIAFIAGTFVFINIFSDSNAVTYADLIVGATVGGGVTWEELAGYSKVSHPQRIKK
jgi:hypothetical protein